VVAAVAWTVVELWASDICFPSLPFRASARRHGGWGQAPREARYRSSRRTLDLASGQSNGTVQADLPSPAAGK
jgi:hypothetical protein